MPADPAVLRTTLNAVLDLLQLKVQTALSFPPERVQVMARDDNTFDPQADQYVMIRAKTQRWNKARDGGGRFYNLAERRITVTLRTRLALDESTQDVEWTTNPTLGHYVTEHALFDALEMWQADDVDGNLLLNEPVHLEEASAAEKPAAERGWGQAGYSFDACFLLDLDQAIQ